MSNLENALKALEATEGGEELKESVLMAIESEKLKGQQMKTKAEQEAIKMRKYKIFAQDIGFNPEEHDLENFKGSLAEKLAKVKDVDESREKLSATEKRFLAQEEKLNNLTSLYEQEMTKRQQAEERNRKSTITNKLLGVLQDKLPFPDLNIEKMINEKMVNLAEDGKNVYFNIEGEDLDFETGVSKYLELPTVKKYVIASQRSGSGQGNPPSGNNNEGESINDRINRVRQYGRMKI